MKITAGRVRPEAIRVEIYAEPGEVHVFTRDGDGPAELSYTVSIPATRPSGDYTPRIVPWYPGARIPLECDRILWYR